MTLTSKSILHGCFKSILIDGQVLHQNDVEFLKIHSKVSIICILRVLLMLLLRGTSQSKVALANVRDLSGS